MTPSAEELLTTTRAVRRRLDFSQPVPREVLRECVRVARQAPSASNRWSVQFVIVTDEERRRELGDAYREAYAAYKDSRGYIGKVDKRDDALNDQQQRTTASAEHLAENFHRAPAIVLACSRGRVDGQPAFRAINLAARLHGLGTCWTSVSLWNEARTAEVVGIPDGEVTICAVTPVAYSTGSGFSPALRPEPEEVIHWDVW